MKFMPKMPVPSRIEHALDTALDSALSVQRPVVLRYVQRARDKHPDLTPTELIEQMEKIYLRTVMGIGGASGAAAAVPGAGTAASVATAAAEITAFVSASAMYVLGLAELHGVPVSDPEVRRALVLAVLLGDGGAAVIAGEVDAGKHWGKVFGQTSAKDKGRISGLNGRLGRMVITRFGARQGALALGRALPLGLGAGVGAVGNLALAKGAIKSAHKAFGSPPKEFPPRVIDVKPAPGSVA